MQSTVKQLELGFSDQFDQYQAIHQEPHGTVLLWEAKAGNGWCKIGPQDSHLIQLLSAQTGRPDRYISVNQFDGWRLVRLLRSLRCLYVDLDGDHPAHHDPEFMADTVGGPLPTAIVYSGRGCHLYWLIDPVPPAALPLWQRTQDELVRMYAPFGADPAARDCTRVLRLVGSTNSKVDREVHGRILKPFRWSLRTLADELLPARPPKPQERAVVRDLGAERVRRGEGQKTASGSIYERWHAVYRDLIAIADWHLLGGVPEGHRDKWLFLSGVALSWFAHPATVQEELNKMARTWTPGLNIFEVVSNLRPVIQRAEKAAAGEKFEWMGKPVDPRYHFKRQTLYDWMSDIIPPPLLPQLRAIIPDSLAAERLHERNKARYESRQRGRKGLGAPWEALGISRRTYFNRKKAGLL